MIDRKLTPNQMIEDIFLAMSVLDKRDAGRKILLRSIREISTGSYNRAWGHVERALPYIKEPISLDAIRRVRKELKMHVTNDVVVLPSREVEAIFTLAALGHVDLAASLEMYLEGANYDEAQIIAQRVLAGDTVEQTNLYLDRDVSSEVYQYAKVLVEKHAKMLPRYVYEDLTAGISSGKSFDELEVEFSAKHPGFEFTKEHYDLVQHQVTALDEDGFDKQLAIEERMKKQTEFAVKKEKKEKAKSKPKPKTRLEEEMSADEEMREDKRTKPKQISHDDPKDSKKTAIVVAAILYDRGAEKLALAILKKAKLSKKELIVRIREKIVTVLRMGSRAAHKFFSVFLRVAGLALALAIFLAVWYALSKTGVMGPAMSRWTFKDIKELMHNSPKAVNRFIADLPSNYAHYVEKLLWSGPNARFKILTALFVALKLNWAYGVGNKIFSEIFDRWMESFSITKLTKVDGKIDDTLKRMGSSYKNVTLDQEKKDIGRTLTQIREQIAVKLYDEFPEAIGISGSGRRSVSVEDVVFEQPPRVQLQTTLNGKSMNLVVFHISESKYITVIHVQGDEKPEQLISKPEKVVESVLRYVSERIAKTKSESAAA